MERKVWKYSLFYVGYEYFIPSSLLLKLRTSKWWCGDEREKFIIKLKLLGECDAHEHHSIDRKTDRTTPTNKIAFHSVYVKMFWFCSQVLEIDADKGIQVCSWIPSYSVVCVWWLSFHQILHQLHSANSLESSKQMEIELNIADVDVVSQVNHFEGNELPLLTLPRMLSTAESVHFRRNR